MLITHRGVDVILVFLLSVYSTFYDFFLNPKGFLDAIPSSAFSLHSPSYLLQSPGVLFPKQSQKPNQSLVSLLLQIKYYKTPKTQKKTLNLTIDTTQHLMHLISTVIKSSIFITHIIISSFNKTCINWYSHSSILIQGED